MGWGFDRGGSGDLTVGKRCDDGLIDLVDISQFASGGIDRQQVCLGQMDLNAKGCSLAERCPLVHAQCRVSMPPMEVRGERRFACHLNKA